MAFLQSLLTVARFEFTRSITWQRIGVTSVLTSFPPAMILIIVLGAGVQLLFMSVIVMVLFVGLLALLLWATPNVHSELEGRSWSYVTSRPAGRYAVLLGKYLNSIAWAVIVSWTAATLCVMVIKSFSGTDVLRPWLALTVLIFAASPFYAAVFSLIGVVFSRKSMVFGAGYVIAFEATLAWIPANINQFTGGFHLFTISTRLFDEWLLPVPEQEWTAIYGNPHVGWSWFCLIALTLTMLAVSLVVIRCREYISSDDPL